MFHPRSRGPLLLHCDVKDCPESATEGVLCSKHFKQNGQHARNNGYFAYNTTLPPLAPGVVSQQASPPTMASQHVPIMRAKRTSRFTFKTVPATVAPSVPSPAPTPISTPNGIENAHSHWHHSPHLAPASYPGSPNGHGTQLPQTRRFTPNTPTPPNSAEYITGSPVQQPNQQPAQSFRSGLRAPVVQGPWSNTSTIDIPEIGRRESSPHVHNHRQSQASPALYHTPLANPSQSQPSHPQPSYAQPSTSRPSHPQPLRSQPSYPQPFIPPAQSFPNLAPTAFMKHAMGTNHGSYLTNSHVTNGVHHTTSIAMEKPQATPSINEGSAGSGYHETSANVTNTNHDGRASPIATHQHSSPAPTMRSTSTPTTPLLAGKSPTTPLLAGKALAEKFLAEKLVAEKHLAKELVAEKYRAEKTQETAVHATVASPIATPAPNTAEEATDVEEHIVAAGSAAKADTPPEPTVKKQKIFDSDAFDAMIYQRHSKPPTAHKNINEYLWLSVDPAIHKLHHRTPEWYAAKQTEIETRPRRKVWFGKVGARIHWMLKQERADRADKKVRHAGEKRQRQQARRQDPQPAAYNRVSDFGRVKKSDLPEEVREDPAWLAACEWHRKSSATASKKRRKVQDASVDAWRMYNHLQNGGSLPGGNYNDDAGR